MSKLKKFTSTVNKDCNKVYLLSLQAIKLANDPLINSDPKKKAAFVKIMKETKSLNKAIAKKSTKISDIIANSTAKSKGNKT